MRHTLPLSLEHRFKSAGPRLSATATASQGDTYKASLEQHAVTPHYLQWKLRREFNRIKQQLAGIPEFFLEPVQRKRHDAWREQHLRAESGNVPEQAKIALLLLFQPKGVSSATQWTCQHLVNKGYAPLVVSNAPLSNADRQLLHPYVWRMTERPNFGYDFGGYRDGIWLLQQWGVDPEVLLILNDSIWFPLYPDETLIDGMERLPADFVGALQLDPQRQTDGVPPSKRPFFGSFFLMVKRAAWQHPAFKVYWSGYRITSNKYKTIRRGERGFSHALMDAGISSAAIYTRTELDRYMLQLPNPQLKKLLADLVTIDENLSTKLLSCIRTYADTSEWRTKAHELALQTTEKQNILATAPLLSLTVFEVPYLKKSRDWNNLKAITLLRERMRSGSLRQPHSSVATELDQLVK